MPAKLTTNEREIVDKFREQAMEHPAVQWFDVGYQDFLFDSQRDLEFPCVFLQSNGVTNGDLRITNNFTLYCLDLPLMEYEADNTEFEFQSQYVDSRDTCLGIINYILGQVRGENRQLFTLRRVGSAVPDQGQLDGATGYRVNIEIEYDSILNTGFEFTPFPMVTIDAHDSTYAVNSGDITLTATVENFTGVPTLVWSSSDGGTIDPTTGVVDDADPGTFTYSVEATFGTEQATDSTQIEWNAAPTGSISQTTGLPSPAIGDTVAFTAAFTDPEGDNLTYQWQVETATPGVFEDIQGETSDVYSFTVDGQTDLTPYTDISGQGTIDAPFPGFQNPSVTNPDGTGWSGDVFTDNVDAYTEYNATFDTDHLWWFTDLDRSGVNSVIAFYADGVDHATTAPLLTYFSNFDFTLGGLNLGGATALYQAAIISDDDIVEIAAAADFSGTNGQGEAVYGFGTARTEVWIGVDEIPTTVDGGTFRVVVSDGENTTTSNELTIS